MAQTTAVPSNTQPFADIIDLVIHKGHGVKGVSETGIKSLPKLFIQPIEERLCITKIMPQSDSIPVIDISNRNDRKVADSICNAAERWGFFLIVNHGVPFEVLDNVKQATHRFFDLPAEEKKKYSKENSPSTNVLNGSSLRKLLSGKTTLVSSIFLRRGLRTLASCLQVRKSI